MLELTVKVININFSSGHRFLQECRLMYEYSWFIQRIKDNQTDGWTRDAAITQAVKDCQTEGVLVEFMKKPSGYPFSGKKCYNYSDLRKIKVFLIA